MIKKQEITFKDLSKEQLSALKELYIESRIKTMTELELKSFAKDVLDLQIHGTVGNEEEREVWKEMNNHFNDTFHSKIQEVIKVKKSNQVNLDEEQEDIQKRLELLEQRKATKNTKAEDMWNDD